MIAFALHLLAIAVLATSWAFAGYGVLPRRLRCEEPFVVWSSAIALGAGGTALAMTALAVLGVLRRGTAIDVAAAVCLLALRGARLARREQTRQRWGRPGGRLEWAALIALTTVLLATLLATLAPPSSMDATIYHLRAPREFLRNHGWGPLEDSHSFQPLYVEMLFAEGMVLGGGVLAALTHWALGLGAIGAAGAWARRLGGRATWAAVIFGASGLFVWESTGAFIDLGLTLFSSLALLWATRTEDDVAPTLLAGVFAGLAGGSKFTGLVVVALAAVAAAAAVWPDRRRGGRRLFGVGALAILVALPWYVRNVMFRGNPVYPLANPLFGLPPIAPELSFSIFTYGLGNDLLHLLTSPFDLLARGDPFDQGWSIGPAYLALSPLGLLVSRGSRTTWLATTTIGVWWLFWFYSSPQTRLLLPVLPIAAGLASVGMGAALASASRSLRLSAGIVLTAAALGGLGSAALFMRHGAKVVFGLESDREFLGRNSWHYVAYENTNRILSPTARVAVEGANNLYYLEVPAQVFLARHPSPPQLRAEGFTHRLTVKDCPLPPPDAAMPVLWEGNYPIRASRLRGGFRNQACARLQVLPPGP